MRKTHLNFIIHDSKEKKDTGKDFKNAHRM